MSAPEPANPILPGFYPDPSITRAGSQFFLVTSSFEYFPGVPIFRSENLVDWEQLGHVLTRPKQLDLTRAASSQGIFAPTLRYRAGRFFMITTNMSHGGTFFVTSEDPAGPWSDPVWVKDPSWGMDPSLFFDDDGSVYYTRHGGKERGAIYQAKIDVESGELDREPQEIWRGTGGIWPEGPHLYKIGHHYYLLIAEGGTSYDHAVTVARADQPFGPFTSCPRNPILTHRARRDLPVQATGHADLVLGPEGRHWMVFLGTRPVDRRHHHLGRETFIAPVDWDDAGWPVVNAGEPISVVAPSERAARALELRDAFSASALGPDWIYLRNPDRSAYSLSARPGWLRLVGSAATLDDPESTTFVGVRQRGHHGQVRVSLDFHPGQAEQRAGLVARMNDDNYYALELALVDGKRTLSLLVRLQGSTRVAECVALPPGNVTLNVDAFPDRYEFSYRCTDLLSATPEAPRSLGAEPTVPLSSERAGGFTGVVFGLYATGVGAVADFSGFESTLARVGT